MNMLIAIEFQYRKCIRDCNNLQLKNYLKSIDKKDAISIYKKFKKLNIKADNFVYNYLKNYDSKYIIEILDKLLLFKKSNFADTSSHIKSFELMIEYKVSDILTLLNLLIECFLDCHYTLSRHLFLYRNEHEIKKLLEFYANYKNLEGKTNILETINDNIIVTKFNFQEQMRILNCINKINYFNHQNIVLEMVKSLYLSKFRTTTEIVELMELCTKYNKDTTLKNVLSVYYSELVTKYCTFKEQCRYIEYLNENQNNNDIARMILCLSSENKSIEDKIKFIDYYKESDNGYKIIQCMNDATFKLCNYLPIEDHFDILDIALNTSNKYRAMQFVKVLFTYVETYKNNMISILNKFIESDYNPNLIELFEESKVPVIKNIDDIISFMDLLQKCDYNPTVLKLMKNESLLKCPMETQIKVIDLLIRNNYNLELLQKMSFASLIYTIENNVIEQEDGIIKFKPLNSK